MIQAVKDMRPLKTLHLSLAVTCEGHKDSSNASASPLFPVHCAFFYDNKGSLKEVAAIQFD